jgi:hypothetical protein
MNESYNIKEIILAIEELNRKKQSRKKAEVKIIPKNEAFFFKYGKYSISPSTDNIIKEAEAHQEHIAKKVIN